MGSSNANESQRATTLRVVTFDVDKRFDRPLHRRRRHRGLMAKLPNMTAEQLFNAHRGILIGAQECAKANDEANASIFIYNAQRVAAELAKRLIEGEVTVVEEVAADL